MLLILEFTRNDLKEWTEILRNIATFGAGIVAFLWFLQTRSYKRQVEVKLLCRSFPLTNDNTLVEISCIIDNKGERWFRITQVSLSIEYLAQVDTTLNKQISKPMWQLLGDNAVIIVESDKTLAVLKGIHQEFTHSIVLPSDVHLIRVTGGPVIPGFPTLSYPSKRTAQNVFDLRSKADY